MKNLLAPVALLVTLAVLLATGSAAQDPPKDPPPPVKPPQDVGKPPESNGGFIFGENRPRDVLLQLASKNPADPKTLRVRVTPSAQATWLLPIYLVKSVVLPTAGDKAPEVRVTLRDALYDDDLKPVIEAAMDTHPKYGKAWSEAMPTNNAVAVTLVLNVDGHDVPLATVARTRKVGQATIPELVFPLPTEAATKLLAADRANVGLTFEESFAGRFIETDLEATLSVSSSAATEFKNKLGKTDKGKEAILLVAVGGGVSNKVSIKQLLSRHIQMEVLSAKDKPVNPALIDSVMAKLFAGITEENNLAKQKDDAVVTFVTSNGIKATASMGEFNKANLGIKKEDETKTRTERTRTWLEKNKTSGEGGGFGVSIKFDVENEKGGTNIDNDENHARALSDILQGVEGKYPVACLSADQVQKVVTNAASVTQIKLGSFTEGQKLIVSPLSLDGHYRQDTEKSRALKEHRAQLVALHQKREALCQEMNDTLAALGKANEQSAANVARLDPDHETALKYTRQTWLFLGGQSMITHLGKLWKGDNKGELAAQHAAAAEEGYASRTAKYEAEEKLYAAAQLGFQVATKGLKDIQANAPALHVRLALLHKQLSEVNRKISDHAREVMILLEK